MKQMNLVIINYEFVSFYLGCTLIKLVISPDVFSIILLLDCVPGRSQLVISPDVFSIILLLYWVPGRSLLVISPDVLSIILLYDIVGLDNLNHIW